MKLVLEDIVKRLGSSQYRNEEHVRVAIVGRILFALGWDLWDPRQVVPELPATPKEDATRVDLALFMPPQFLRPAVFIEVKAVGKLISSLTAAEVQLRDYNRNNQADISILTDGRYWFFYLSSAAGDFSSKCFEKFDLMSKDTLDDVELALDAFLAKASVESGDAVNEARRYLKRTDTERIMFDAIPAAQRDAEDDPSTSLVDFFLRRCSERGAECSRERAVAFLREAKTRSAQGTTQLAKELPPLVQKKSASEVQPVAQIPSQGSIEQLRLVNKRSANASGRHSSAGRFVVFKDSVAAPSTPGFAGGYKTLRDRLVLEKVLIRQVSETAGILVLTRDYEFDSPSAAASVFCGRAANGGEWKK